MIHFFPITVESEIGTPFDDELVRLGILHRFFGLNMDMRYRTVAGLIFRVYPRLIIASVKASIRSLKSEPRPDVLVVASDIQALIIGSCFRLMGRNCKVVFQTLILTTKSSWVARWLQRAIYQIIFNVIDIAICHSRYEVSTYVGRYPNARCKFIFIPYGTTIARRASLLEVAHRRSSVPAGGRIIVASAGRSGRDYRTLVEAAHGLNCEVHIICDTAGPFKNLQLGEQVKLFSNHYNNSYLEILSKADIVAIPLLDLTISSGQMVLLQSFALQKPTIITETYTTVDYVEACVDALFVPIGNVDALRSAISKLIDDAALRDYLGRNAGQSFERQFTTEAFVQSLLKNVGDS